MQATRSSHSYLRGSYFSREKRVTKYQLLQYFYRYLITRHVPGMREEWRKWKPILSIYFRIYKAFKIAQYQWFCFSKKYTCIVITQKRHESASEIEFNFLKSDI